MRKRRKYVWLIVLLLGLIFAVTRGRSGGPEIKPGSHLLVDLQGDYVEAAPQDLFGRLVVESHTTLFDLLQSMRAAARDERIAGMVLRVGPLDIGWAKAAEIRTAIQQFRTSDKPVVAVMEQEIFGSNLEYYVASAADRVHLAPTTTAPLTGLASQFMFLGGLWEKLDVEMHVEKVREYKTMGDFLANKQMTPEHREMADSLLDSINGEFMRGIAEARGLDVERVRQLIDECPSSPGEYEDAGLSDGTKYLRTVHEALGGEQAPLVALDDYRKVPVESVGLNVGPKIGVLFASGSIVTGESSTSVQGQSIGADTIAEALDAIAADDSIEALVLRVDSPGGSALASDLIWRARRTVQDRKPVVVSMSDVAASGGYFMAVGADRILANPATLTGSIGVVVARPVFKQFLANAGIHVETLTRGKYAYLNDLTVSLPPDGRKKLLAEVEHVYAEFVGRVAAGRSMPVDEVNEIGRGRVWTGRQALEKGLIDEVGGFWDAVDAAKRLAEIDAESEVELVFFPQAKPLAERVGELLGARATAELPEPWGTLAKALTPPFAPGSVLALMPYAVEVR